MQLTVKKNIFAIPGSLRSGSSNHAILNFLKSMAPADIAFSIYDRLADIPPFDPGSDHDMPQEAVAELRNFITNADAVIICTPEYAFGIPGQLKNALDWMVSSGSFTGKLTALITASTGGENAHEALKKVLGAIDANRQEDITLLISFIRSKMDGNGNITDEQTSDNLKAVLTTVINAIK
ncbi:NADPH-dependent FMN reductase [Mucilaginibacter sp.]|uniref:NADPH-dependent FMN reductase n=1 Tax=Mucilaginibacter sp. TaxID=1882438 RepID=UPI0025CFB5BC|nr:NADPH-dependent FMN reductase [Mucilaginibacter sp.]